MPKSTTPKITHDEATTEIARRNAPKNTPERETYPARHIMQAGTKALQALAAKAPKAPAKPAPAPATKNPPVVTPSKVATAAAEAIATATTPEGEKGWMRTMVRTRTQLLSAGDLKAVRQAAREALAEAGIKVGK